MLTNDEIAKIRARDESLPVGRWWTDTDDSGECWIRIPAHDLNFGDMESTDKCCWDYAEFIAHSRMDVHRLLVSLTSLLDDHRKAHALLDSAGVWTGADDLMHDRVSALVDEVKRLRAEVEVPPAAPLPTPDPTQQWTGRPSDVSDFEY